MKPLFYILLYPFYLFYLSVVFIRNLLFDQSIFPSKKLDCIVISVGNISFGGTGKTPFTIALTKELQSKYHIAILSRGYKRDSRGTVLVSDGENISKEWRLTGDEPHLIAQKLSGIPIVVDEDRFRGGRYLSDNFNPDIIILDDGFQHRKLHRDIDIVLLDASAPIGFNYWREPFGALNRASIFLLTKFYDKNKLEYWKKRFSTFNKPTFSVNYQIDGELIGLKDKSLNTANIKGKSVLTFSGIANHDSFDNTVQQLGCDIIDSFSFKDHHVYGDQDLKSIEKKYNRLNPDFILTTEKDIIKLPPTELPIYAISIRMDLSKEFIDYINNNIRLLD